MKGRCKNEVKAPKDSEVYCGNHRDMVQMMPCKAFRVSQKVLELEKELNLKHQGI